MATPLSNRLKEQVQKYEKAARVASAIQRQAQANRVVSETARAAREFKNQLPPKQ